VYQKVLQYKDKHIWTISLAKAFQFKSNISLEGKLFVVLYTDFTWASVYSLVSSINIPEMSSNNSSWNDGHFNTSDEHSESSPKIFIPCK